MCEEVDRFCEMLDTLDHETRSGFVHHCCMLLGKHEERNDRPWDDHVPVAEHYHELTVEDLHQRMATLVADVDIMGEFLVQGLFRGLVDFWEQIADPDGMSESIDKQLDVLQRVQDELKKPRHERRRQASDEELRSFLDHVETMMAGVPGRRECNADTLAMIHEELKGTRVNTTTAVRTMTPVPSLIPLGEAGVTDFDRYSVVPGAKLQPDFFV